MRARFWPISSGSRNRQPDHVAMDQVRGVGNRALGVTSSPGVPLGWHSEGWIGYTAFLPATSQRLSSKSLNLVSSDLASMAGPRRAEEARTNRDARGSRRPLERKSYWSNTTRNWASLGSQWLLSHRKEPAQSYTSKRSPLLCHTTVLVRELEDK